MVAMVLSWSRAVGTRSPVLASNRRFRDGGLGGGAIFRGHGIRFRKTSARLGRAGARGRGILGGGCCKRMQVESRGYVAAFSPSGPVVREF